MTVLTLQPDAAAGNDTFIEEGNPTYNYGVSAGLYVNTDTGTSYRTLIKFDLSSIPNGALISSAVLTLHTIVVADVDSMTIAAHRLYATKVFYEGAKDGAAPDAETDGSTWNHRNAYSTAQIAWGAAGGLAGTDYATASTATRAVTVSNADYTWTLTRDVQEFVDGTENNGWILISSGAISKTFASSDNGTAGNRPELVVTYTTPNTSPLTWTIGIVWNGTDVVDEAAYTTALRIERGRDGPLDELRAGKCTITLDNYTDRFNPWNAGGALYTYLKPGKMVFVSCVYHGCGPYQLFSGYIEDIRPAGKLGEKVCTITAYDGWHRLKDRQANMSIVVADTDNDTLLTNVMTAVTGSSNFDTDGSTALFWSNDKAGQVLQDLVNSEMGYLWIRQGTLPILVMARGPDYAGRSGTTFVDGDLVDIAVNQPWDLICNLATIKGYIPATEAEAAVWTLGEVISIAHDVSVTIWCPYQDSNGQACTCASVVTPAATTDYLANAQADGLGADMTADLTVAITKYTETSKIVLTNDDPGDVTLYVTLFKIRGNAVVYRPFIVTASDATSQTTYGVREREFDLQWCQSVSDAQTMATAFVAFWKDAQVMPVIRLQRRLPLMLKNLVQLNQLDLFDLATFTSTAYGISANFLVGRITYWTESTMQDLWGEIQLEPFT